MTSSRQDCNLSTTPFISTLPAARSNIFHVIQYVIDQGGINFIFLCLLCLGLSRIATSYNVLHYFANTENLLFLQLAPNDLQPDR